MTIEEFWEGLKDSEIFFLALVISALAWLIYLYVRSRLNDAFDKELYGSGAGIGLETTETDVTIISKEHFFHPINKQEIWTVTFEFSNGKRLFLAVRDIKQYGVLTVGDRGTLRYYDKTFIGFKREENDD